MLTISEAPGSIGPCRMTPLTTSPRGLMPRLAMKLLPPSPETVRIERELSAMPPRRLTVQEAREQTERHLRTAREQLSKNGPGNAADGSTSESLIVSPSSPTPRASTRSSTARPIGAR